MMSHIRQVFYIFILLCRVSDLQAGTFAYITNQGADNVSVLDTASEKKVAAIAVGRKGDADKLPEDLRAMESPNTRKRLADVATDTFPIKKNA